MCHFPVGKDDKFCPTCGMSFAYDRGRSHISVLGIDAKEVQEVMLAMIEKTKSQHIERPPSPWASGSFYLIVFIIVIAALSVVGHMLPIIALPIIIIGGIIALSVIGAFQMRQDSKLSEKNFLELMALSFKYLPWIRKRDTTKT